MIVLLAALLLAPKGFAAQDLKFDVWEVGSFMVKDVGGNKRVIIIHPVTNASPLKPAPKASMKIGQSKNIEDPR